MTYLFIIPLLFGIALLFLNEKHGLDEDVVTKWMRSHVMEVECSPMNAIVI